MTVEILLGIGVALIGWVLRTFVKRQDGLHDKVDNIAERVAKIEGVTYHINGRLANGFQNELSKIHTLESEVRQVSKDVGHLTEMFLEHHEGEEHRIATAFRRMQEES